VQKTYFIRAGRLQRGHTFEEQFEFIRNPACRARNNCKWIWPTSAKESFVARSCFDHFSFPASEPNSTNVSFDGVDVNAKVSFGSFAEVAAHRRHVRFTDHRTLSAQVGYVRKVPTRDPCTAANGVAI
jgi:hypothetical protein